MTSSLLRALVQNFLLFYCVSALFIIGILFVQIFSYNLFTFLCPFDAHDQCFIFAVLRSFCTCDLLIGKYHNVFCFNLFDF